MIPGLILWANTFALHQFVVREVCTQLRRDLDADRLEEWYPAGTIEGEDLRLEKWALGIGKKTLWVRMPSGRKPVVTRSPRAQPKGTPPNRKRKKR